MIADNTPVIIGAGQITEKSVAPESARSPLLLMTDAVLAAAADAGINDQALRGTDLVMVTTMFTDDGLVNPPGALADRLGADRAACVVSGFGGTSPQSMLHHAMGRISRGEAKLVVLAGAEAQRTKLDAGRAGLALNWGVDCRRPAPALFSGVGPAEGASNEEHAHSLSVPAYSYPLFENALRGHYGHSIEAHQGRLGELMSRFSRVAADNPLAWFPRARTPEEIITVTDKNRNTAFPYTKLMNAMLLVNQSAALIVTSSAEARRLGVDLSRCVYCHGQAQAADHWHLLNRENFFSSPAIRIIGEAVLDMAAAGLDEIDFFDLYSCFPSSIQITRDMLGIAVDDPRDLTVTGGLPCFGGPGNNYVMHALAGMVEKLREKPGSKGLITGNSFYLTKHSAGIYSTEPGPEGGWVDRGAACQKAVDQRPAPEANPEPSGEAYIETYTVTFNQKNEPETGIVIGCTRDNRRFAAYTPGDKALLAAMTGEDFLGAPGTVRRDGNINLFTPV